MNHQRIYIKSEEDDRQVIDLDFCDTHEKLKGTYLDVYEGVKSEIVHHSKFCDGSNLSTTYLGKETMAR